MGKTYSVGSAIHVGGSPLSDELQAYVDEIVVDDDLHQPSMFAVTLLDPKHDIVSRTNLQPGAEVEITIEGQGAADDEPLLAGNVISIECDYDEVGSRVVVRGYDATHRLHLGRRTQVFRNVTDDDIFKQVVEQAGLTVGRLEPTSEVHDNVTQANLTGWEFLSGRAHALGLDLVVAGKEVLLKAPTTASEAPTEAGADADPASINPRHLRFGYNLIAFHGRISAAEQVGRIEVRGYDENRKEAVVATAQPGTVAAGVDAADPQKLGTLFGDTSFVHITRAKTASEVEDRAKAVAEHLGSSAAELEGTARGSSALRAGAAVRVTKASDQFNGAYVLSRARHVMDRSGYRTHFTVSGRRDRSLLGLVNHASNGASDGNGAGSRQRIGTSLVRAIVTDNADPEELGRVKVKFPSIDDQMISNWASMVSLGAGPASGSIFLPAVGDEVLVGFEQGNVDRPLVVGGLHNKLDKPPTYGQLLDDGKVIGRTIVSRKGHEITLWDSDDIEGVHIVAVDGSGSSVVSIALDGKDSKLVIQSSGDISVEAEGNVSLKGSKVTVEAQGDLVLKGGMVKIN